ncbi:MFS transporter [Glaciimonas sp. CA11.2]|uniref:MFS transporter n=1 Tax=unclassified Glaciimonas TaxID=2644401 RepID=UPI002AB52A88|nr:MULTISPECIES: MFS transporter [unclassified Glaciimonas]MDY7546426.1 MFS transporter [Glaciimonas sp. CA11.2]MEB0014096.1 MFS transporter [Glaciimonas sp. Cout2]MEB0083428.1 MFS transporter [Glaciimonas sp. Gout2]MEB0162555.1 MFS transporter [Glaciimonas sp. CA11.2]
MTLLGFPALLKYGLFGLPLALVALPVYVYVPQFYSDRFGISLSLIGLILLITRLFDAFIDPAIGRWLDHAHTEDRFRNAIWLGVPLLAIGFSALFLPPAFAERFPLSWLVLALLIVYVGFSIGTIAHQSWGAALTQALEQRSRLTATREACGLIGVVLAAALPSLLGIRWLPPIFVILLVASAFILKLAPKPGPSNGIIMETTDRGAFLSGVLLPFGNSRFCWLFGIFVVNGIAAAIPATLFLFFVDDQLQLGKYGGLFLMLYFLAGAISMPGWSALARRFGEARVWFTAMLLAIAAFVWAYGLTAGDMLPFSLICIMSGFALGADLLLPPALLAGVIANGGHSSQKEGAYFGIWSWATKINLALAAGISLPLLQYLGYQPHLINHQGAQALAIGYAVLPCALKLIAAMILWRAPLRHV